MKKAGRILITIILLALIIGLICTGVGLMTGGELSRVYELLDSRYHITMYVQYAQEVVKILIAEL